jgi:predicted outer membrane protein
MKAKALSSGKLTGMAVCALGLTFLVGCGNDARTPALDRNNLVAGESEADLNKNVLQKLHTANEHEIKLTDLADDKASAQSVKDYAAMLKKEHESADKKVMDLADKLDIDLADAGDADPAIRDEFDRIHSRLESLEGDAFDRAFIDQMVQDHDKVISEVSMFQSRSTQAEVKGLLDELLPSLKTHLQHGKDIQSGWSGGSRGDEGKGKQQQNQGKDFEEPVDQGKGKGEEPVKQEQGKAEEPVKQEQGKAEEPVKQEQGKAEEPVKQEQGKAEEPVKQEQGKAEEPVKQGQGKAEEPVKQEQGKAEEPVKQEQGKAEEPVKQEQSKAEKPAKQEQGKAQEPAKPQQEPAKQQAPKQEPKAA